ncbi:unnamed protein product [Urochloa humidicola]
MAISSTMFRRSVRLVALGLGLDFFSAQIMLEIFCFLHAFYGDYVGGDWSLAVNGGCHEYDGVLCGWFSTDDVYIDAFYCVGVRICCELICAGCVQGVCRLAGLATTDMATGGWRIVLFLRSDSDGLVVICNCSVRFDLHLLVFSSWCSFVPLVGLLLVYSYLEKSSWSFPAGVTSLLVDWSRWQSLGRQISVVSAMDFLGVQRFKRTSISSMCQLLPRLASKIKMWLLQKLLRRAGVRLQVASSPFPFFHGGSDERRLRLPATRITGRVLQGLGCNFPSFRDVLVSYQCKLLYQ